MCCEAACSYFAACRNVIVAQSLGAEVFPSLHTPLYNSNIYFQEKKT